MRRLVVLLSAVVLAGAIGAADAQTAQPAKPARARQKAAQKPATPPPDTPHATSATIRRHRWRPRRRNRLPRAGSAPCASRRTPAGGRPAAARATPRDVATCAQNKDNDAAIAGCTRVIDDSKVKLKGRADAYYNRGNAHSAKGDFAAAIADYDEAIKLDPKTQAP